MLRRKLRFKHLLKCPVLSDIRNRNLALQQPYIEDEDDVMMMFLFEENN